MSFSAQNIRGRVTETTTKFGRYYTMFQTLEKDIKKAQPSYIKGLIVGPGYRRNDSGDNFLGVYQPFELVNSLIRAGAENYSIDIIDNQEIVLDELRKEPKLINISKDFYESFMGKVVSKSSDGANYYNSFFPNNIVQYTGCMKTVKLPADIGTRLNLKLDDLTSLMLEKESYDVIICTSVLSHYQRDITGKADPSDRIMEMFKDAVKVNGYLLTSELTPFIQGWDILNTRWDDSGTMHSTSAQIMKKINC